MCKEVTVKTTVDQRSGKWQSLWPVTHYTTASWSK